MPIKHLEEINMTYLQHAIRSAKFAWWSFRLAIVCSLHSVFPWLFTDTFSENVLRLARRLEEESNAKY